MSTPTQLTIDRNEEELTAIRIKQLSKIAFQEARQSDDIRKDLAQNFRMRSKPLQVRDKVLYWQEVKSKIRSDGSKGGVRHGTPLWQDQPEHQQRNKRSTQRGPGRPGQTSSKEINPFDKVRMTARFQDELVKILEHRLKPGTDLARKEGSTSVWLA